MLPNSARIKSSSDFARVTKLGRRVTSNSLVGYLLIQKSSEFNPNPDPSAGQGKSSAKLGLIVGKSVGNSVVRHRIARQIRHAVREELSKLPDGALLVVRAMRKPENAFTETKNLLNSLPKAKA